MTIIRTRAGKSAPLTNTEIDNMHLRPVVSVSAAYAATAANNRDTLVVTGTTTVTLGESSAMISQSETGDYRLGVVNVGSDTVTVTAVGGNTIFGDTSLSLAAGDAVTLIAVSGGYAITARSGGEDAVTLEGKSLSHVLARTNHTGTQAPATISPQGASSGLDADTVDGNHASAFATSGHNHTGTYVPPARTITAGNGMTGGGDLSANRTLTLGTPGSVTASSTNATQASSHTHALDDGSVTGAKLAAAAAGNIIGARDDEAKTGTSSSPGNEVANFIAHQTGTLRFRVTVSRPSGTEGSTARFRWYRNGVAFGTEEAVTGGSAPEERTQDLSVTAGDYVQLFCYSTSGATYRAANVRISASAATHGLGSIASVAPIGARQTS